MGKGDKKSRRGKIIMGSSGVSRQKKKNTFIPKVVEKKAEPKEIPPAAEAVVEKTKEPAPKKPAAKTTKAKTTKSTTPKGKKEAKKTTTKAAVKKEAKPKEEEKDEEKT